MQLIMAVEEAGQPEQMRQQVALRPSALRKQRVVNAAAQLALSLAPQLVGWCHLHSGGSFLLS